MPTENTWVGLRLDPLDTLFFRDGRPFDAANRVQGGLPNPQTLAGAVRTTLLGASGFFQKHPRADLATILREGDRAVTGAHFRGPFLALAKGTEVQPLFEPPLVVARTKEGKWIRRAPTAIDMPGWDDPDKLLPVMWKGGEKPDPKGEEYWLTLAGLTAVLNGGKPDGGQSVEKKSLTEFDNRTGIVIDTNSLATVEGQLYGIRLLSLNPGIKADEWKGWKVCLYAEMQPGDGGSLDCAAALNGTPIPFGGEGKYVRATTVPARNWPKVDSTRVSSMWYLATPTFLPFRGAAGAKRPLPDGVAAALSGGGVAVSGWDVARRGPNATRFAVPAGACYFLKSAAAEAGFLDESLTDIKNLRQSGWGFALQGKWEVG